MASSSSPLNVAHQHAANADDYVAQGLLIPAAEEHYKAAEAFLVCVEAATDDNTKRTLRMLYNDHSKAGKELQRRIAKLREENKDPNLPQKLTSHASTSGTIAPPTAPPQVPSPPPHARNRMSESQQAIEESFMVLGQRSDSGDPFNQFWKITEGMLDYLSQPVAFATAPLAPPTPEHTPRLRDASSSSDTDIEDALSRRLSRGIGLVKAARSRMLTRNDSPATVSKSESGRAGRSHSFPPQPQDVGSAGAGDDWDDDLGHDDDDDMADSFCLIPSKSDAVAKALQEENIALKAELETLQKRLASAEGMLKMRQEQDQQLRDSILLARKEAHRAMVSSSVVPRPTQAQVDLASLNINVPPIPPAVAALNPVNPGRDREAQLVRRVRELEDEVRIVRAENEKQKAMIVRFRERWEKLKESSKRKKEAKAAAQATNVVDDRIDEEPEAEAEAERSEA
ncbi:hypothetical protein IEO21_02435 [Rhodonia placenta]|uniref:MIT domain-containing protein n=1 Tax=Rhodonia placenta TaxID=104341 RepID=A0A8H7P834_9APHY|nr:hypothetical protein IEO21_02435 [Postia placenta]